MCVGGGGSAGFCKSNTAKKWQDINQYHQHCHSIQNQKKNHKPDVKESQVSAGTAAFAQGFALEK